MTGLLLARKMDGTYGHMIEGKFVPLSPGRSYQQKCVVNVELRACWATYTIINELLPTR